MIKKSLERKTVIRRQNKLAPGNGTRNLSTIVNWGLYLMMCLTDSDHNQSYSNADEFSCSFWVLLETIMFVHPVWHNPLIVHVIPPPICNYIKGIKKFLYEDVPNGPNTTPQNIEQCNICSIGLFSLYKGKNNLLAIRAQILCTNDHCILALFCNSFFNFNYYCKTACLISPRKH